MKIRGLVGSYRRMGNTEVFVKEALMEVQRLGAEVGMLRLADLRIEPCKGCMAYACMYARHSTFSLPFDLKPGMHLWA